MELSTKMMNAQTLQGSRRVVLTYPNRPREPQHEKIVHAALAERLAVLLGLSYGGEYDPTRRYDAHPYLVPSGTVVGLHEAHELGLNEEGTLELSRFGEIIVDAKGQTSIPGVFAAGDVTTVPYKQIVIAVGEGAKASLSAFDHLIRTSAPA